MRKASPLLRASLVSGFLALLKFVAFVQTNSLIVLASCLDSAVDTFVSFLNNKVQRYALKAPDREHPFGHGGFEVISSFAQGIIIGFSGIVIIAQGIQRLSRSSHQQPLDGFESFLFSIGVMVFAAISGAALSFYLARHEKSLEAKHERSLAVSSDRAHYLGDFLANLSGAAGLGLVWYTQRPELDQIFGIIGGLGLVHAAYPVLKKSLKDILQEEVNVELQQKIVETIIEADPRIKGVHRLRSRGAGPWKFVDFHLKLPTNLSFQEAHDISEHVTRNLRRKIPKIDVVIHLDPETEPDDDWWDPKYNPPKIEK